MLLTNLMFPFDLKILNGFKTIESKNFKDISIQLSLGLILVKMEER